MNRNKWVLRFLIMSLCLNVIFLFGAGAYIAKRGGFAFIASKVSPTTSKSFPLIDTKISIISSLPKKSDQIVFLGDSLTAYGKWDELLEINNSVNRGISGDTTAGVLNRLSQITQIHPSKIFLLIGINDLQTNKSVASAAANYKKIIDTIRKDSPETKIIMTSVFPVNNKKYIANFPVNPVTINNEVILLNNELQKLTEANKVYYFDLFKDVVDNGELKDSLTLDGLHVNGEGYAIWKDKIKSFIS